MKRKFNYMLGYIFIEHNILIKHKNPENTIELLFRIKHTEIYSEFSHPVYIVLLLPETAPKKKNKKKLVFQ